MHVGSIQLRLAIKTSLAHGQGGVVGECINAWNQAHISDGTPRLFLDRIVALTYTHSFGLLSSPPV